MRNPGEKQSFMVLAPAQMLGLRGDPKSRNERRNGGITERRKITPNPKRWNRGITERRKIPPNPKRRNHGTVDWRKIPPNPKRRNHGTAEWRKIPPNPKRRNDGKSPEILKDGIAKKQPKSQKTESRS